MTCVWKRFVQTLFSQPNHRRMGAPAFQPAAVESLEERTVLSVSTLAVDSDTYITSGSETAEAANFGGSDVVRLYNGVGAVDRMLIRANLSSLAASGSAITSAVLEFYQTGGFTNPEHPTMNLSIYAVAQQWTEGTQTFASGTSNGASWLQAQLGVDWTTPGGAFSSFDFGNGANGLVQTATLPAFASAGWVQFDITAAVRAWQDGLVANNGLVFVISSGGEYTEHEFASSESGNGPRLVVNVLNSAIPPRSPVANFILSQVHDQNTQWSALGGQVIQSIAHKLRTIEQNNGQAVPTSNPSNAEVSKGHASDHNPTLGAALPPALV